MDVVYVTGNENKAKFFNRMVGMDIEHIHADVEEIQSLDLREVIEHKAKVAYEKLKRPVVIEDTSVVLPVMGSLPGPLVKWFIQEIELEDICRLLDGKDRTAIAGAAIAYFDGKILEVFESELKGTIAEHPEGDSGFGWNGIFIPDGCDLTLGQMSDSEFRKWYGKIKPFAEVAEFLHSLDLH